MADKNEKEPIGDKDIADREQTNYETEQSTIFVKHVYNTKTPVKNGGIKRLIICAVALLLCGALIGSIFIVKKFLPDNTSSSTVSAVEESTIDILKYSDIVKSSIVEIDGKDVTVDTNIESVYVVNGYEEYTLLPFFTEAQKNNTTSSAAASSSENAVSYNTNWQIKDIEKSKTDSESIASLIKSMLTVKAFREMENTFESVEAYHEHFGMEKNLTAGVVFKFNDGSEELMIRVGDILATGNGYYLMTTFSEKVYAVYTDYTEPFFSSVKELGNSTIIEPIVQADNNSSYFQNDALARFDTIKLSGEVFDGKTYEFVMNKGVSADYMPYRMSAPYSRPASNEFIANILGFADDGVNAGVLYSYKMTEGEKAEYGLDNPKCVIELKVADYSFKLTIGGMVNDGTESLTAIIDGKEQVFGISQDDLAFLIEASNNITKMFNSDFIMEDIYTVESVEFKFQKGTYRFDIKHTKREDDENVIDTEVKLGNSVMNTQSFKLLYQRVLMLSLIDYITEADKTTPVLTVTFNFIEDVEPRVVEFTESKNDIYHYIAWVDGTPLGDVLKSGVDDLMDCVEIYLNGGTITDTWS